jgi:LuxR family maltose regulon positive regulatory protein
MEGNLQASVQEIEKALGMMRTAAPALVGEEVVSQQVSIFLALDRLTETQMALKAHGFAFDGGFSYPELKPDASVPHAIGLLYNSALRVLLYRAGAKREQQLLRRGIELADVLIAASFRCQHLPIVLQTLLLRAQMNAALGNEHAALTDLARVLELAEPEGFISVFLEEGQPIAKLLMTLIESNLLQRVSPDYVKKILAAFPGTGSTPEVRSAQSVMLVGDESLIEPLTPRELEVLQLIAAGDSNQLIAEKLVITLSAVKKHTGNIFGKLNVNSRTQAIARARQLGLLSSDA